MIPNNGDQLGCTIYLSCAIIIKNPMTIHLEGLQRSFSSIFLSCDPKLFTSPPSGHSFPGWEVTSSRGSAFP